MSVPPIRVVVIIGSVRAERFAPVVANWFLGRLEPHDDLDVDVVDLAGLTLPNELDGTGDTAAFAHRIARADAFVVITPEYNHSFPGPLKTAIDSAYEQWWAKPVGFVSYGGTSGGLRAVEQLRLVFAELHAVTVRHSVTFAHVHDLFGPDATPRDPHHAEQAVEALLSQLTWWAAALRSARTSTPYPG
ncbi:NADPH-dependent FMN reductase [Micromonospora sp. NPDC000089]|uniref:NADPH-dependent FMN reductase n=1 Tax=unclassified Micromonospora TaxID=2617518 RepID=UPI0036C92CAF